MRYYFLHVAKLINDWMKKSLLLTRADIFNNLFKQESQFEHYELLECPLITYQIQITNFDFLNHTQYIVITSYFAALNLPYAPHNNLYVYVVGGKSAETLKRKNYNIKYTSHDAINLKLQIIQDQIHDNILYLSGNHITVHMPPNVSRKIFYSTYYKKSLSTKQILRYQQGIDYIQLYSANSAHTLLSLFIKNDLIDFIKHTIIITISDKVANIMKLYCHKIKIYNNHEAILEYLNNNDYSKLP